MWRCKLMYVNDEKDPFHWSTLTYDPSFVLLLERIRYMMTYVLCEMSWFGVCSTNILYAIDAAMTDVCVCVFLCVNLFPTNYVRIHFGININPSFFLCVRLSLSLSNNVSCRQAPNGQIGCRAFARRSEHTCIISYTYCRLRCLAHMVLTEYIYICESYDMWYIPLHSVREEREMHIVRRYIVIWNFMPRPWWQQCADMLNLSATCLRA